jgi:hypothetical protein
VLLSGSGSVERVVQQLYPDAVLDMVSADPKSAATSGSSHVLSAAPIEMDPENLDIANPYMEYSQAKSVGTCDLDHGNTLPGSSS